MIPTLMLGGSNAIAPVAGGGGGGGGNGAKWNSADKTANITLSNADETASANNSLFESVRATYNTLNSSNGGKYYWEIEVDTLGDVSDMFVGVKAAGDTITSNVTPLSGGHALWRGNGQYFTGGGWSAGASPAAYASGDVLMLALDVDNAKLFCGVNGTWNNSGDPAAGMNASFTGMPTATDYAPMLATDNVPGTVTATLVSDSALQTYAAPSGFTAGLPPP